MPNYAQKVEQTLLRNETFGTIASAYGFDARYRPRDQVSKAKQAGTHWEALVGFVAGVEGEQYATNWMRGVFFHILEQHAKRIPHLATSRDGADRKGEGFFAFGACSAFKLLPASLETARSDCSLPQSGQRTARQPASRALRVVTVSLSPSSTHAIHTCHRSIPLPAHSHTVLA